MKKNLFILMAGALALCACNPEGKEPGNGPTPPVDPVFALEWAYPVGGYNARIVPAIDDNGNVYINSYSTNEVFKISNTGQLLWKVAPGYAGGTGSSLSIEKDGSAVYAMGGAKGAQYVETGLYILNGADGSVANTFLNPKFFANGGTPGIGVNGTTCPSYDETHIYVGNGGTTGTVLSIKKADFSREAYVSGNAAGEGGPNGGCSSNIAISKSGKLAFMSNGLYIVDYASMQHPTLENATLGEYVYYDQQVRNNYGWGAGKEIGVTCGAIDGVEHFFYSIYGKDNKTYACAIKADGSTATPTFEHLCDNAAKSDQGGGIIGAQGEYIFGLKNATDAPGGLYAVTTAGELAWRYESGTHVSSAPALDNQGNVHFADEAGFYYILKPDYEKKTATEVVKVAIVELLVEAGVEVAPESTAKTWTSIMLDKSGKSYVATTFYPVGGDVAAEGVGYVLCMSYTTCTGVGASSWPMKYADQYHSGIQK